jgi:hypothetical protein
LSPGLDSLRGTAKTGLYTKNHAVFGNLAKGAAFDRMIDSDREHGIDRASVDKLCPRYNRRRQLVEEVGGDL